MLCRPSPLAEALRIQAHKINRDRFELICQKTGRFMFAVSDVAAMAMACDLDWKDFTVIPPQVVK